MSIQFGKWSFGGAPIAREYIERVDLLLAPFGPDSRQEYAGPGVRILYRAFHTTRESHCEKQPYIAHSGAIVTWDGRLDNRRELINELGGDLTIDATDVEIVAAAHQQWGSTRFLGKLVGDWALSVFNPIDHSLILGRDAIGTRPLFYSFDANEITWSTLLDPLILLAKKTYALSEEYVAGWFSHFPAPHLTPYCGVDAVPPASCLFMQPGRHRLCTYWDFRPEYRIRYRTDTEYEEHFCKVFSTAVQRRLRADRPVLAELSGGLDSSSIVCTADTIIRRNPGTFPRLDTISWYADNEPDLDERPYFTKVEQKRGRAGFHVDLAALKTSSPLDYIEFEFAEEAFAATPIPANLHAELFKQYADCMRAGGHRVVLSGIGGDEVMGGGVPSPIPELQDLLQELHFSTFIRQLTRWAEKMRTNRVEVLWEFIRETLARSLGVARGITQPAPWFHRGFMRRNRRALDAYPCRLKLRGPLPSFQDRIHKLESCRRFVSFCDLRSHVLREMRFPFLDRNLLEFMCAIPREQIVGVGRRRSLMKRSLLSVLPEELVTRKRKTISQVRTTIPPSEWHSLAEIGQSLVSERLGFVDSIQFAKSLRSAQLGLEVPIYPLMQTRTFEFWLRHLMRRGILEMPESRKASRLSLKLEKNGVGPLPQAKKFS